MANFSLGLALFSYALQASLLVRASQGRFLSRFPIFYSYVFFVLATDSASYLVHFLRPECYPSVFWFFFLVWTVAEFAVLLEASDHVFEPYPPIRRLGRLLTAGICTLFFFGFILPSFLGHQSRRVELLDFSRSAFLTKAALIVALLAAARLYQLPLGKNISGMLLGFSVYLAINVANISLAERFTQVYAEVFEVVGPSSYVLALTIWNVALWRYEPVVPARPAVRDVVKDMSERPGDRLGRYDTELMRLFRR